MLSPVIMDVNQKGNPESSGLAHPQRLSTSGRKRTGDTVSFLFSLAHLSSAVTASVERGMFLKIKRLTDCGAACCLEASEPLINQICRLRGGPRSL